MRQITGVGFLGAYFDSTFRNKTPVATDVFTLTIYDTPFGTAPALTPLVTTAISLTSRTDTGTDRGTSDIF